jgi:tetratricopeptide (TPR) repeat protein
VRRVLKDREGSVASFEEALRCDPQFAAAHFAIGETLRYLGGERQRMLDAYRRAIALDQKYVRAHHVLGQLLAALNDLDGAIDELETVAKLDPKNAVVYYDLGHARYRKGMLEKAAAAFRTGTQVDPSDVQCYLGLGSCLYLQGELRQAIDVFEQAINIQPGDPHARYNLGNALRDRGELDAAVVAYRAATRLAPTHAAAQSALVDALLSQGDVQGAADAARWSLTRLPPGEPLRQNLTRGLERATFLLALEKKIPAILDGRESPPAPVDGLGLAHVCEHQKKWHAAVRLYSEALTAQAPPEERDRAARSAVLTADGALRQQALEWLRGALDGLARRAGQEDAAGRQRVRARLGRWLSDHDLAPVRDVKALAELPATERGAWQQLWREVLALDNRLR